MGLAVGVVGRVDATPDDDQLVDRQESWLKSRSRQSGAAPCRTEVVDIDGDVAVAGETGVGSS
jgi:hypothetical protein